jgi:sugar phosphate isomerase/epimerase
MAELPLGGRPANWLYCADSTTEKDGMYKSLNTGAIGVKADLAGALNLAKQHGFDAIDLPIGEALRIADAQGVTAVRALFADAGVQCGPWGVPVDWRADEEKYQQGLRDLPRVAALGQQLNALRVNTWVMSGQNERTRQEQYTYLVERFRPIATILAEYGCRLGLEFIGPKTSRARFQHEFIYTAGDMLEFAHAIGPNVGLLHDCWHWYTSGGTIAELRAMQGQDIVSVHVNDAPAGLVRDEQLDNQRLLPMESGVIDLPGYLRTLREIGYDGPVTVEPFSARLRQLSPDAAVAETAAALDRAWRAAGL